MMSFLPKLKFTITPRLLSGFLIAAVPLSALAVYSIVRIGEVSEVINKLEALQTRMGATLRIESGITALRREVLAFQVAQKPDPTAMNAVATKVTKDFADLMPQITPVRRPLAEKAQSLLLQYVGNLPILEKAHREREIAFLEKLEPIGTKIRTIMTKLREDAVAQKTFELAAAIGSAQELLILGRQDAMRYLMMNEPARAVSAKERLDRFRTEALALQPIVPAAMAPKLQTALDELPGFIAAFDETRAAIVAMDKLVNDTSRKIALETVAAVDVWAKAQVEAAKQANDSVDEAMETMKLSAEIGLGAALALTLLIAILAGRGISKPLQSLTRTTSRLSSGELNIEVPGTKRQDELGDLSRAVLVFQAGLKEAEEARAERAIARERAERERTDALQAMARQVEAETGSAVSDVAAQMEHMAGNAQEMARSAESVARDSSSVSASAEEAQRNVGTVAAATEELGVSIREISQQVAGTTLATRRAAERGMQGRESIMTLAEKVERIGGVARTIADIAGRTNLLALNATIEAARAGDAGKGFAVVATEVKQLALQTSRATEEISRQVQEVTLATEAAVGMVREMADAVAEVDKATASIAAAMEEQTAATQEIARAVSETATAVNDVSQAIGVVARETDNAGTLAQSVRGGADDARKSVAHLREVIVRIVRQSAPEVNRREHLRHPLNLPVIIDCPGLQPIACQLHDISEGGCSLNDSVTNLPVGQTVRVRGDGMLSGINLPARVHAGPPAEGRARLIFLDLDEGTVGKLRAILDRGSKLAA